MPGVSFWARSRFNLNIHNFDPSYSVGVDGLYSFFFFFLFSKNTQMILPIICSHVDQCLIFFYIIPDNIQRLQATPRLVSIYLGFPRFLGLCFSSHTISLDRLHNIVFILSCRKKKKSPRTPMRVCRRCEVIPTPIVSDNITLVFFFFFLLIYGRKPKIGNTGLHENSS